MKKQGWLLLSALAAVGCGGDNGLYDDLAGRDGGKGLGGKKDGGSGGADDDVCGKHSVVSDHAIPDMLIVLDRSGSMARDGNENRTDRWGGSAQAVSQLVTKYSMGVNFGLVTFPGTPSSGGLIDWLGGGGSMQCAPGAVDVPIGADQGPAINQAISRMRPGGYTPTADTLKAVKDVIGEPNVADQNVTAAKYVLLVTDGDPNCSPDWTPRGGGGGGGAGGADADPVAREETIAAIEELTKAGVDTFVVGYETAGTSFEQQLDLMAAAGGTGETKHRSVKNAEDLAATFDELASYATQCSFRLAKTVDRDFITVTVGGKDRRRDQQEDGWELASDERTVTLLGKACTDAKNGGAFTVNVECEPVYGY